MGKTARSMMFGERDVDALLETHAGRIAALTDALHLARAKSEHSSPVGAGTPYDSIWALRFVLSHDDDAEALSAATRTLRWREENAEMLAAAARGETLERFAPMERLIAADYHGKTLDGAPVYIIRAGLSNTMAVMAANEEDDVVEFMMYRKEMGAVMCDERTRRTRKLTKLLTVNDLNFVSVLHGTDKKFQKVLSRASKLSEDYYPQLLDRAVLINVPYVFSAIWGVFKNMLSAKTRAKVAICPVSDTRKGDVRKCPFAKLLDLSTIPSFLAGECRCKGGCVRGVANDQKTLIGAMTDDGLIAHNVPARGKIDVFAEVDATDAVAWRLLVEKGGVEVTATLRPAGWRKGDDVSKCTTLIRKFKHRDGDGTKEDVIVSPGKGTIAFTFSNAHSTWNSKDIKYSVDVVGGESGAAKEGEKETETDPTDLTDLTDLTEDKRESPAADALGEDLRAMKLEATPARAQTEVPSR
jgi:hypothetical protein